MNTIQKLSTQDLYLNKVNQLKKRELNYVTIVPDENLLHLEQFRSILKKCFRDISKLYYYKNPYNYHKCKNYIKYISLIEMNPSITKDKKLLSNNTFFISRESIKQRNFVVNELGYHSHIFFNPNIMNRCISNTNFKSIIIDIFKRYNIKVDVKFYTKDDFYDLSTFIEYHTKQLENLDVNFLVFNF